MAILLAIKILRSNYPYDLVFKFSTSAIGKSKLQDSSFRCSGGKEIASRDPVGSNFLNLNLNIYSPSNTTLQMIMILGSVPMVPTKTLYP